MDRCRICQAQIDNTTRFRCADCKDFFMCVNCFAEGREAEKHKNKHRYQIIVCKLHKWKCYSWYCTIDTVGTIGWRIRVILMWHLYTETTFSKLSNIWPKLGCWRRIPTNRTSRQLWSRKLARCVRTARQQNKGRMLWALHGSLRQERQMALPSMYITIRRSIISDQLIAW